MGNEMLFRRCELINQSTLHIDSWQKIFLQKARMCDMSIHCSEAILVIIKDLLLIAISAGIVGAIRKSIQLDGCANNLFKCLIGISQKKD